MQLIAHYPIHELHILPHIGKPVIGMTTDENTTCGVVERVENGHLFLQPIPSSCALQSKNILTTKAWGFGGRPLMGLSALWLLPFLFI